MSIVARGDVMAVVLAAGIIAPVGIAAQGAGDIAPFFFDPATPDILTLDGQIDARAPLQFERALQRHPNVTTLSLRSVGGSVYAALPMAYNVRKAGLKTDIPSQDACASACSYLFFAGVERTADGHLGVHRLVGADLDTGQAALADIFSAFDEFGVPISVITQMMATPADEMYWYEPTEMETLGLLGRVVAEAEAETGPVLTVKPYGEGGHATLAEAVAAAPEGARIEMYPGVYRGSTLVDKYVEIVGVGSRDRIVLEADDGDVIRWTAPGGTVTGVTIRQFGAATALHAGIAILSGAPEISGNALTSTSGPAIAVKGRDSAPTISGNVFTDSGRSLESELDRVGYGDDRETLYDSGMGSGMLVSDGARGTVENNTFSGLPRYGIVIRDKAETLVRKNRFQTSDWGGVAVTDARGTIDENEFVGLEYAIDIGPRADPMVRNNTIRDGQQGISIAGPARVNGTGPVMSPADIPYGTIQGNRIFNNAGSGIKITFGAVPVVTGNVITGNDYGISIHLGGKGTIYDNDLRGNRRQAINDDPPNKNRFYTAGGDYEAWGNAM